VIFGIGTDIVEYARIESLWSRYGLRFSMRVLSEHELQKLRTHPAPARLIGKHFAAKEAFSKAVGSGLREPVSLRRITITNDDLGKPLLMFDDMLRTHLAQLGITGHHLSISDEQNMIVAFVVLETS
jgi:holo-[acyl-carrier protein] synthase